MKINIQKLTILSLALVFIAACARPVAQFEIPQKEYNSKTEVVFGNKSEDSEAYVWDFGDGDSSTATEPIHLYTKAGTYNVTLKAIKGKKEAEIVQKITIAEIPLKAAFEMTRASEVAPVEVTFKNLSEGADNYVWEFGDHTKSSEENPTHKYRFSGNYTVKLTAFKDRKREFFEQQIVIDAPEEACLILIETKYGDMKVRLYDETPLHRDNFIKLAEEGFYDGTLFHRIIEGFMIQGGDPDSKNAKAGQAIGMGGLNYTVPAEFNPEFVHYKGVLAAARQPDEVNPKKESSGSQFYIVHGSEVTELMLTAIERRKGIRYTPEQRSKYKELGGYPPLDNEYTVFGEVVEGLDVIDKIAKAQKDRRDRPIEDIKMTVKAIK
jgi:cyclophilin family peptidyl-prolyl cis-trans isomerase